MTVSPTARLAVAENRLEAVQRHGPIIHLHHPTLAWYYNSDLIIILCREWSRPRSVGGDSRGGAQWKSRAVWENSRLRYIISVIKGFDDKIHNNYLGELKGVEGQCQRWCASTDVSERSQFEAPLLAVSSNNEAPLLVARANVFRVPVGGPIHYP